jgi:hypothetical protein
MLRDLHDRMCGIAASVEATEMAVFSAARGMGGLDLRNVLHVRADDATDEERADAVRAFQDLVRPCVADGKNGVFLVNEASDERGRLQYCLVTVSRQADAITGAVAFIVRRKNLDEAKAALARVKGRAK